MVTKNSIANEGAAEKMADENGAHGSWLFPALLVVVLLAAWWIGPQGPVGEKQRSSPTPEAGWTAPPQGETAALTIDFGNGVQRQFAALPYREGTTVAKLMQEAAKFRPGIVFAQLGEGETGFLTSIDGVENRGANGRNWRYRVNDQHAEVSFCLFQLQPGDRVLWEFVLDE